MTHAPVFESKVIAITGAASGIGRACALGAASDGARVALIDRAETGPAEAEIAAAGGIADSICCDVQDTDAVNQAFSRLCQTNANQVEIVIPGCR